MSQIQTLTGAQCKVYIGGTLYPADSIQYTLDYGEQEIYGIDSVYPQEIATSRVSVQGSISGFKLHGDGGLQGGNIRPLIKDILKAPYLSLRIQNRKTKVDILFVPNIKVTREQVTINAKNTVKVNFNFKGIVPFNVLDRS